MNYIDYPTNLSVQRLSSPVLKRPYHHGDLRNALLAAARQILEEESAAAVSLREVARRAGVSHAAPYRHFPSHEALLAELAREGFETLQTALVGAAAMGQTEADRIAAMGAAYIRFVTSRTTLARLMFGPQLPNREHIPALAEAAETIGKTIGTALNDPSRGAAVWAAVHGLAMLMLENVVNLGQHTANDASTTTEAEVLLRKLFAPER